MKRLFVAAVIGVGLMISGPAVGKDGDVKPDAKAAVAAKADAGTDAKAAAPATKLPNKVPASPGEAVGLAKDVFKAGKAKNWWLMSAGAIWLIMFGLKMAKLFKKMGKRWAYITVAGLSMASMLAAKFGGGVSWEAAIAIMTSGPFMAFANDFVRRGEERGS
jgi:hypothetical protein